MKHYDHAIVYSSNTQPQALSEEQSRLSDAPIPVKVARDDLEPMDRLDYSNLGEHQVEGLAYSGVPTSHRDGRINKNPVNVKYEDVILERSTPKQGEQPNWSRVGRRSLPFDGIQSSQGAKNLRRHRDGDLLHNSSRLPSELPEFIGGQSRKYEQRWAVKKDLERHVSNHTRKLNFVCEHCDGNFTVQDSLRRHLANRHSAQFSKTTAACELFKSSSDAMGSSVTTFTGTESPATRNPANNTDVKHLYPDETSWFGIDRHAEDKPAPDDYNATLMLGCRNAPREPSYPALVSFIGQTGKFVLQGSYLCPLMAAGAGKSSLIRLLTRLSNGVDSSNKIEDMNRVPDRRDGNPERPKATEVNAAVVSHLDNSAPCGELPDFGVHRDDTHPNVNNLVDAKHEASAHAVPTQNDKLAIVGMAGRFRNAANVDTFWDLLTKGLDVHRKIPADRFAANDYCAATVRVQTKSRRPFDDGSGLFNHRFFNTNQSEAVQNNAQLRMALLVTYEALEMSGFAQSGRVGYELKIADPIPGEKLTRQQMDNAFRTRIHRTRHS